MNNNTFIISSRAYFQQWCVWKLVLVWELLEEWIERLVEGVLWLKKRVIHVQTLKKVFGKNLSSCLCDGIISGVLDREHRAQGKGGQGGGAQDDSGAGEGGTGVGNMP